MAENESIGGISVEIVGDYSQLQADINSAAQIAAKGGQDIAKGLNSGAASVDVLATAAKIATSSIDGLTEKISALVGAGMSTAQAMAQVQSEALAVAAAAGSAGAAVGGLSEEERAAATAATSVSQAFAAMGAAVAAVAEEEKSAAAAAAAVSGAWSAAAAAGAGLSDEEKAIAAAAAAAAAAEKAAADAAAILAKSQQEATAALKAFTDGAGALMGIGASITAAVTVPILGIGGAALKVAGDFEQTKIAFTTMMGSAQAATAFLTQLRNFALTTPFEFPDLTRAAQKMTALGFSTQQVIPMLRTIGDAVAGLGQGSETINRLVKAFGDMQAKGKVSAQEMNQFAESGIAAWKAVADAIGVSIPKAMKMAEQGMISSATAIPAILDSMNQKFSGMMEKQSQTLLGQWSNIKDKIVTILTELGTALAPGAKILVGALNGVLEAAQSAVHVFSGLPAPIQAVVIAAAGLAAATGPAIAGLGALGFAIRGIQEALPAVQAGLKLAGVSADSFGSAMSGITSKLAPVALALAVVAGAVAAFHFGGAQKALEDFVGAVKSNFSSIADLVTTGLSGLAESAASIFRAGMEGVAASIPQPIKDAFESVRESVKGIIQKISDEAKSIFGGMGSSISQAFSKISIWDVVAPQFANLRDGLIGVTGLVEGLGGKYKSMADAAVANLDRVTKANLDMAHSAAVAAGGFTVSATSITAVSAAVKGLTDKQNEANSALKTAKAALDEVKKAADGSAESHQLIARATSEYDKALKAANITIKESATAHKTANDAVRLAKAGLDELRAAYAAGAVSQEAVTQATAEYDRALKAAGGSVKSQIDRLGELRKEMQEVAAFGKAIGPALESASKSYEDYLVSLYDGGKKASSILSTLTEDITKAELAAGRMSGAPKAAMESYITTLKEAQARMRDFAEMDDISKAWADILAKRLAYAEKVAEEARKIDEQMAADARKTQLMVEQGDLAHQERMIANDRATAAAKQKNNEITAFEKIALDQKTYDKEAALQAAALQRELAIIDQVTTAEVDSASKREAIILRIQALQDKATGTAAIAAINAQSEAYNVLGLQSEKALQNIIKESQQAVAILERQGAAVGLINAGKEKGLEAEIKLRELTGQSAASQIIALDNIRQHQKDLYDSTHLWGDLWVDIKNDMLKGYNQIGGAVAAIIVDHKELGKTFLNLAKEVEKSIIEDIVNAYMKALRLAITGTTDDVKTLKKSVEDLSKSLKDAFGGVPTETGGAPMGGTSGGGGGGASMSGGGALAAAGSLASIGTMISSIIGNFQFAGMNKSLDLIVKHTLQIANDMANRRKDAWDQHLALVAKLTEMQTTSATLTAQATNDTVGGFARGLAGHASTTVEALGRGFSAILQNSSEWQAAQAIIAVLREGFSLTLSTTTAIINTLQQGFNGLAKVMNDLIAGMANVMISGFNSIIAGINGVSHYATGGMVPNTGLAMLHAGELVIPAADVPNLPDLPGVPQPGSPSSPSADTYRAAPAAGGGTQTNTFYIYQATDPRETTRQIAQTLKRITPSAAAYST